MNVDVVLWIAERKAVLSTFFALLSLVHYIRYVRHAKETHRHDRKRYGASLLMYLGAVLSKPTAVSVVVPDFWPLEQVRWNTW